MRTIAYALALVAILATAIAIAAAGPSLAMAHDDTPPPAPTGVHASDGPNPGTATIAWNAPPDDAPSGDTSADDAPAFYRVGWVSADDIAAAQDWLDAFAFVDVANRGQTAYIVKGLTPGVRYAFIVAAVNRRFGAAAWSEWSYLTPSAGASPACPTPTPAPTPTPTLTPPTRTPWPTPTGTGDYDTDQDGLIEISNLAQLAAIRTDLNGDGIIAHSSYAAAFPNAIAGMGCPADGCIGYELTADLNFDTNGNGQADAGDAYWNDGVGWLPIGDNFHLFSAHFDGNNHTIANLYINRNDNFIGLFGITSRISSIKRIGLVSVHISGYTHVGGLVGHNYGVITDSYATGKVSGSNVIGGLVGSNESSINDSYVMGSVAGYDQTGGLAGNNFGVITDSYTAGSVSGDDDHIGGLVGVSQGRILGSYSSSNVSGGNVVGGLVGYSDVSIFGSYATGSVSGRYDHVGGLVGSNVRGTITAAYATGAVTGSGDDIGGLVGRIEAGPVTASYATGRVSTSGDTFYIGGLVGYDAGNSAISNSYWDTQTSGQAHSAAGGIGLTTAQLQSPTDNTGIYANWNPEYWDFGAADQYPVLQYAVLDPTAQRP